MTLSTSNSNQAKPRPVLVLLCSAIVVVSFAMARPKPTSFSNPSWYWQAKVEWKKCANIVLAGNSRAYRGLSPIEFEKVLGGTAVNAGFSSGTYSKEYCDYLETLFDEDDTTPNILVAGITHNAICDLDRKNNGFVDAMKKSKESMLTGEQQQLTSVYVAAFDSLAKVYSSTNNENYIQKFFSNGWVSSDYKIRDIAKGLLSYKKYFENGQYLCSKPELEKTIQSLKYISSRGIEVHCIWLPASPKMSSLENKESGLHVDEIEAMFVKHGLDWISFPDTDYTSYDGSHLEARSAARFSLDSATEVKERLLE